MGQWPTQLEYAYGKQCDKKFLVLDMSRKRSHNICNILIFSEEKKKRQFCHDERIFQRWKKSEGHKFPQVYYFCNLFDYFYNSFDYFTDLFVNVHDM